MDKESTEKRKQEFAVFFSKLVPYITSHYEALRLQGERPDRLGIEWTFTKAEDKYPHFVVDMGCEDFYLSETSFE